MTSQVTPTSCFEKEDGAISLSINGRLSPYEISWIDNLQLQTLSRENLAAGEYKVVIRDNIGCAQEYSFMVPKPPFTSSCGIYIPTAFSPNGDGMNDVFFISGSQLRRTLNSMHIYDRWGELVFSLDSHCTTIGNNSCGWDGQFNGQAAPGGVYVYLIKVQVEGVFTPVIYSGQLSLIR